MRKRRESDQKKPKEMKIPSRKTCFIVLFLLVLRSWMIPSIAVYGFDVSGMDSFDTGGFDMNVGEGTGQLPEDWEESYAGEVMIVIGTEKKEILRSIPLPGQNRRMIRRSLHNGI